MAIIGKFKKPYGTGYKVYVGTTSITGTGSVDTGLSTIVAASVTVEESTSGLMAVAKITSISGGTIDIEVATYDGTNFNAPATTEVKVHVIAVGY